MPISVRCPGCKKGYKAPDRAAGRTLKCAACGAKMSVPEPLIDPADILLGGEQTAHVSSNARTPVSEPQEVAEETAPRPKIRKKDIASLKPLTTNDPPFWRRHLHWLLVLAMIPLAGSLLIEHSQPDLGPIIDKLSDLPPDSRVNMDDLINSLPDHRLPGAWLPRNTVAHWGLALGATALFMLFFMFLASDGSAKPLQVLGVGLFTATVGIGLLLLVQTVAMASSGRLYGRGIAIVISLILNFIAFSYAAAADPSNDFVLSFLGFTFGVGLCEELVKTLPLFWHREEDEGKPWRGLPIWGLASGAGFGIAEGILYCSRYYNGIHGPGIYVVRFLSCVALHSIWTGSAAITLYLRRDSFNEVESWAEWILPTLVVIGIPMVLHGLYDTSLKRDMNGVAMLVAVVSFAWLAFLSSRLYGSDDAEANRAMLAEYKRRRKVVS